MSKERGMQVLDVVKDHFTGKLRAIKVLFQIGSS
jgi:hypothetical protein